MFLKDLFQETYFSLSSNKPRSALTILGIVIGIGSVIAMVSIGAGATKNITANIESLGSNLLIVMPGVQKNSGSVVRGGMGSATTLTSEDSVAIENQIAGIKSIAPTVSTRKQVKTTKGTNTNTSIYGITPAYVDIKTLALETGTFLTDSHIDKISKVAILGPTARDDLFEEGINPIGQKIRIDSLEFTVIGVTEAKGGSGMGSADDLIYIPLSTAQHYFMGSKSVSNINIQAEKENMMTSIQEDVTNLLLKRHGISDPLSADFSIMNQTDIMNTMSSVTGTLTMLLGAIASISLLVGGIGIMNMMLTTVTERTREIGLRKSLGAKRKDISMQFLSESVMLTFIGGAIGVLLGWGVSLLINKFGGMTTDVSLWSVALAFFVAAAIGIIFGYYPARRAAALNPIEALRYE
ncbi:MAG: multidrug ABC transporter substrate-binding protein [Parcubacteria group bacterium CG10_big_fil_rev_8_21_14_0_10_36_14]|nr:MAG: multidrug ABC transporter substrate-binding protein [Parcubacteria group bacterium CG10_big_fil_rev_8_21_14_0_10_36_14]